MRRGLYKKRLRSGPGGRRRTWRRRSISVVGRRGNSTVKAEPCARRAVQRDAASQRLGQLAGDPEADARARVLAFDGGPFEALKDPLLVGGRDADAVIAHGQPDHRLVALALDLDGGAGPVLDRVADQVGDDLIQARRVRRCLPAGCRGAA